MTENDLVRAIENSKITVLRSIQKNLPADLSSFVEDVVQETYLKYYLAFKDKPCLEGDSLHRWLYVVARNQCRNVWRARKKEGSLPFHFSDDFSDIEAANFLEEEETLSGKEKTEKWVRVSVDELPEPYRQTTAYRLAGYKLEMIAEKLGVSLGTVKSRLARGREMLAKIMNKNQKEQEQDL
ncbi:RNA polymerase sigma factor [Leptospira idonii]|uniref:RNA polymerase sigma factor n=1 Tax=Leptospira idonii TaxID=1193500 RepID=A0A4V3JYH4_9LEPT|nr:RNA polymerase sigma factor [Leptospira idonii]TGN20866.1 RNA polymerase sigma factor [Leptospira idonii]